MHMMYGERQSQNTMYDIYEKRKMKDRKEKKRKGRQEKEIWKQVKQGGREEGRCTLFYYYSIYSTY